MSNLFWYLCEDGLRMILRPAFNLYLSIATGFMLLYFVFLAVNFAKSEPETAKKFIRKKLIAFIVPVVVGSLMAM